MFKWNSWWFYGIVGGFLGFLSMILIFITGYFTCSNGCYPIFFLSEVTRLILEYLSLYWFTKESTSLLLLPFLYIGIGALLGIMVYLIIKNKWFVLIPIGLLICLLVINSESHVESSFVYRPEYVSELNRNELFPETYEDCFTNNTRSREKVKVFDMTFENNGFKEKHVIRFDLLCIYQGDDFSTGKQSQNQYEHGGTGGYSNLVKPLSTKVGATYLTPFCDIPNPGEYTQVVVYSMYPVKEVTSCTSVSRDVFMNAPKIPIN